MSAEFPTYMCGNTQSIHQFIQIHVRTDVGNSTTAKHCQSLTEGVCLNREHNCSDDNIDGQGEELSVDCCPSPSHHFVLESRMTKNENVSNEC